MQWLVFVSFHKEMVCDGLSGAFWRRRTCRDFEERPYSPGHPPRVSLRWAEAGIPLVCERRWSGKVNCVSMVTYSTLYQRPQP
jgi:hypothetical protein